MIERIDPDRKGTIIDVWDDVIGKLDMLDVLETLIRTAIAPVSKNAKHGRFDMVFVVYPRGDKFKIDATAREAVNLMRDAGIVCGCVGFDRDNTYWLIRRSQYQWAIHLMGGEPGAQLNRPKRLWKDKPRRSIWRGLLDELLR